MDNDLCQRDLTLFVTLASGPRCFKKEWASLTAKIQLTKVVWDTGSDIQVRLLASMLAGRHQWQRVPKRSLLPKGPKAPKEEVMVLSGNAKGDLGSVVRIEDTRVTVGPLRGKATRHNTAQHDISNLISIATK